MVWHYGALFKANPYETLPDKVIREDKRWKIMEKKINRDGTVKITVEIKPAEGKTQVKPFRKVIEFPIDYKDLPIRVSSHSARAVPRALVLAEEMCED